MRREVKDDTGCRKLFDLSGGDPEQRQRLFSEHLQTTLGAWTDILNASSEPLPLVISGMASSTIGWIELPYAAIPLRLDGSTLKIERVPWKSPRGVGETILVSGAASPDEMMRGEETEAVGLFSTMLNQPLEALLILPGTHSKHLRISRNEITSIRTSMTGELFDLLSKQSVLRASIELGGEIDHQGFDDGVACLQKRGLPSALFQTRTRHVLQGASGRANASFLSGVLIGAELQQAGIEPGLAVMLAASPEISNLYSRALKLLGLPEPHLFSADEVSLAVPRAHEMILARVKR